MRMSKGWGGVAAALIVLAAFGGWVRARLGPSPITPAAQDPEKEGLRREVAALKARLRAVPPASPSGQTAAVAAAAPAQAPRVPVEDLLARAQAALQAQDADAFVDAMDALLEAGEGAYPGIVSLMQTLGDGEALLGTPQGRKASQRWHRDVAYHAPRLGGLMDFILVRGGEPDYATLFAVGLLKTGAPCGLPRERQVGIMLRLLKHDFPDGQKGYVWEAAFEAVVKLQATEALPALESLYAGAKQGDRGGFAKVMATLGEAGEASLQGLLARSRDPDERRNLIDALGRIEGREGTGSPLLWEIAARKEDPEERRQALRLLSSRPANMDRLLRDWEGPGFSSKERFAMLGNFMGVTAKDPQARDRLWGLYERDPSGREDVLDAFLKQGDPQAHKAFVDSLRSGRMSDAMARNLRYLDAPAVRENAAALQALAADRSRSVKARYGAAGALSEVDPRAAIDALLSGFEGLEERDRLYLLQEIGDDADGETRGRLRGLAEHDPSPRVQDAAKRLGQP